MKKNNWERITNKLIAFQVVLIILKITFPIILIIAVILNISEIWEFVLLLINDIAEAAR